MQVRATQSRERVKGETPLWGQGAKPLGFPFISHRMGRRKRPTACAWFRRKHVSEEKGRVAAAAAGAGGTDAVLCRPVFRGHLFVADGRVVREPVRRAGELRADAAEQHVPAGTEEHMGIVTAVRAGDLAAGVPAGGNAQNAQRPLNGIPKHSAAAIPDAVLCHAADLDADVRLRRRHQPHGDGAGDGARAVAGG